MLYISKSDFIIKNDPTHPEKMRTMLAFERETYAEKLNANREFYTKSHTNLIRTAIDCMEGNSIEEKVFGQFTNYLLKIEDLVFVHDQEGVFQEIEKATEYLFLKIYTADMLSTKTTEQFYFDFVKFVKKVNPRLFRRIVINLGIGSEKLYQHDSIAHTFLKNISESDRDILEMENFKNIKDPIEFFKEFISGRKYSLKFKKELQNHLEHMAYIYVSNGHHKNEENIEITKWIFDNTNVLRRDEVASQNANQVKSEFEYNLNISKYIP